MYFFQPASKFPCQDDRFKYIDEIKTRYPSLTIENTNTAAIIDVRSIADVLENAAPTHKASATNDGITSKTFANRKTHQQNQNKMVKIEKSTTFYSDECLVCPVFICSQFSS
jgi:hypothetical protein